MNTLKQVRALAAQLGAKVEDDKIDNAHECLVEAPHGKVWMCCGVHELVDSTNRPWKPDYADVLNRMRYGLENYPEGLACEWCYPDETKH